MASPAESSLISKLESSISSTPIFSLFSDHLLPFADLRNPNKKSKTRDQTLIVRSLAKQYLSLLNRSLSILPKRIPELANLRSDNTDQTSDVPLELFRTFRLCLDCLELLSTQLMCKPSSVYMQRMRLVRSLEAWGLYREAGNEGFNILERLRALDLGTKKKTSSGYFLPELLENNGDTEFASLVVDVVVSILRSVAMMQSKDSGDYSKVLALIKEVKLWFRLLDANAYEKFHKVLVSYLGKCTLFLVGEIMNFDGDLIHDFCVATLNEYEKSSIKDQIFKFARRICSSVFLLPNEKPSVMINILKCVLDSAAGQCKVDGENLGIEFVQVISYCANKCHTASTVFCSTVAEHLNDLAGHFYQVMAPLDLILRLYATGLSFISSVVKSRVGDNTSSESGKNEHAVVFLHDGVGNLGPLLVLLQSYSCVGCKKNSLSCGVSCKDSADQKSSHSYSHCGTSLTCTEKNRNAYLLACLNALKFLCQPLAELVNSEKRKIIAETGSASVSTMLYTVEQAFHWLCDIFVLFNSTISECKRDGFDDHNAILSVAVAAFILSIRTKHNLKRTVHLIKRLIASEWFQPQELRYMYASLYNVGILLYKNKQVDEASKALKLCCKASWTYVTLLCHKFMHKSDRSDSDFSEDTILDFVAEACMRTAFLLDVLHQCGSLKVKKITVNSLENWAAAEDLFTKLPGPMSLVKQWVKIICKLNENVDGDDNDSALYSLLSSSKKMSKRTIGKILQQELLAYDEMDARCPEFCQRMQMKIIDFLLQDVYITQDSHVQRSAILLRKGWTIKSQGFEGLRDCIQCLSDAISMINGETCGRGSSTCHQLAMAYSLRALCIQEAEPNSKQFFHDIVAAVNLWLSIPVQDYGLAYDEGIVFSDSTLLLLYHLVDILSLKGYSSFHHNIYELIIRLCEWKNVPLKKCLSMLWESRRLTHGLCFSPINDAFLMNVLRDYGEFKFIDFWIDCLKQSPPSLVGFQQNFSYLFASFPSGSNYHGTSIQWDITVDEIKETAFQLISSAPVTSSSIFFAGYLYYYLSERLVATGRLFEALSYAKESHRLRTKLFQEKFTYSIAEKLDKYTEGGDCIKTHSIQDLRMRKKVAREVWALNTIPFNVEACYLSPWKVLECYLESTLQVGVIHEVIGNGVEAESYLLWGKDISCTQNLPLFTVLFSSTLGMLYRKKQSWDLSEKELQSAKEVLMHGCRDFSCSKCRLMLEANVDRQLGDLNRSIFNASRDVSMERLYLAASLYKSALGKLNHSEWRNSVSCPEEVHDSSENCFACSATNQPDTMKSAHRRPGSKAKMEVRQTRKTNNPLLNEQNTRLTRSRYRSSQNQNVDSRCEVRSICPKLKCWFCLAMEVKESLLLDNFICMKWEFFRRRICLRLLICIGKCQEVEDQIHEVHKTIIQSIHMLVSRNPFVDSCSPVQLTSLLDLASKEFSGDVFAIERASILYNICWISLKSCHSSGVRTTCCDLFHVQLPEIVSWLKLSFILCREVPSLFQKVSRLLSVVYILSSTVQFSLPPDSKVLSESHWASYFHQASLGSHLNYQFCLDMIGKCNAQHHVDDQGSHGTGFSCIGVEIDNLPRVAPESTQDLDQFVTGFFSSLPCTTLICISLIGGSYASLLQELLICPPSVPAWMLLSRLSFNTQPVVLLLPVDSVSDDSSDDDGSECGSEEFSKINGLAQPWHCPWGATVVDDVAPTFKFILEENYSSSSNFPLEDTNKSRILWWVRRKKLDYRLGKLLRNLEDLWLGPWRYVLLGERSNCSQLDSVLKQLMRNLKSKCKVDTNESFLKVILEGASLGLDGETYTSQLLSQHKGCFIGKSGYLRNQGCETLSKQSEGLEKSSSLAIQLLHEAVNELEKEGSVNREPVILVLDYEVQMLPWENLPMLRKQEVYRMPSVGSICLTLDRSCHHQEGVGQIPAAFPSIDPLDAFYLLNPGGDLNCTQDQFESWFKDQNLEGKAGSAPSPEELAMALKSHDLFLYFGHGSGEQYISLQEIQKLENCAATFLMGCSSGSLLLNGCYIPRGAALSYLRAGSPTTFANLWEVTDKDIDRFGKAMLEAWLRERNSAVGCTQCNSVAKEFEAMSIKGNKGNNKKRVSKKKVAKACDEDIVECCNHRRKIGSFMGQARESCSLPFLIGAAPVCYGVPTGIRRKKDL